MGLALDQASTLHAIEQPDNVAFAHQHLVGQLLLEDVGRALQLHQHVKLRRCQVMLFKLHGETPSNLGDDTEQIYPGSDFSNRPLAHMFFLRPTSLSINEFCEVVKSRLLRVSSTPQKPSFLRGPSSVQNTRTHSRGLLGFHYFAFTHKIWCYSNNPII